MKVSVINLNAESVGDIELDDSVFGVDVRSDLLARMVNWQLAKRRAGTHKVKGRSEVSATTKKPFRQKGTGRARAGSLVGTQYRGGGIAHGPTPRSHAHDLPKKVRKLGLKTALAAKAKEAKLVVLDDAKLAEPKTKVLRDHLGKLGWGSALVIDGNEVDVNFQLAARNIIGIDVLPQVGANVYDILRKDTLVLTKNAVSALEERLK
ncbi:MAG: 50S ribosomal protein L4 [Alphaproteobacteria bacterium]|nr:50S ribosomal protein L4 [Alphaproteobacteria bacterium]